MRQLTLALTVAAVTFFSASALQAADQTEHITRTVALEPGGTLRLRSFSGRVTITASDRHDVAIDAVRRASRERLDAIKLEIRTEGPRVIVIDANRRESSWYEFFGRNNVVDTDFDIQVPRRTNVDVSVFSAPVTITSVEGTQKVHGFSSRLRVDDAGGSVQAHTFSGPIAIHERSWPSDRRVDVHTFSGDIEVQMPESAQANVAFNSFSGHLNSALPMTLNSSSRRALRARLGAGGSDAGELRLRTFSGNVKIDR
jgi:hypothetical protein